MTGAFDAAAEAQTQFSFYDANLRRTRWKFYVSEVLILGTSASITITGVLNPGDARVPACLSAIVAMLVGLRGVFHWHENWTRSAIAAGKINNEMRLYRSGSDPYQDPDNRDAMLIKRLNEIQVAESQTWDSLPEPTARKD